MKATATATPTIAVFGNPNAGKSTVFNRLTGLSQRIGNYPGVTVEKKEGWLQGIAKRVRLIDVPGTYSLAAHSPDEMVAVDVLLGERGTEKRPDVVLHVVDASNLERNLYLFSQLCELGIPIVVALSMVDVAQDRGRTIDFERLSERLGCPVVPVGAHRGQGIDKLREALVATMERYSVETFIERVSCLPDEIESAVAELMAEFGEDFKVRTGRSMARFEMRRALIDHAGEEPERLAQLLGEGFRERLRQTRERLEASQALPAQEAAARYAWVHERVAPCLEQEARGEISFTERADSVLTHWLWGTAIFLGVMLLVFQSIFSWAAPLMEVVDAAFGSLGAWIATFLPAGVLQSLIVDGVIAGVGAIVIFLPQILILFLFIGLLEDCGYMARAAFLMDRVMRPCGLSGKSFIPMLSGFACAIPGIMAARVIEDRRDRFATILVTPLMSCSARLPVYAILIGTFIPNNTIIPGLLGLQAVTLLGLYLLGIVTAVAMAWIFRSTLLRGPRPTFVLELPSYKWPSMGNVALRLRDRARAFLVRAGSIILAITVIVWALLYFPHPSSIAERYEAQRQAVEQQAAAANVPPGDVEEQLAQLEREEAGEYLRQSFFGRAGKFVQPVFEPLGWDWKISMATLASFPAREIVVSTLGVIYNLGEETDEESPQLRERLRQARREDTGEPVYSIPVALSLMVFFALCCQCGATLATIKRETNSWSWTVFTFVYMTVLAYIGAFLTYQIGVRL